MKIKPIKDKNARQQWASAHTRCQACGQREVFTVLHVHHIIRRSRSDEPCNFLRLCPFCHNLAGGHRIRSNELGGYFPILTLGMQVMLKRLRDPTEADEGRLVELRHGESLPEPVPVHWWFLRAWTEATGERKDT